MTDRKLRGPRQAGNLRRPITNGYERAQHNTPAVRHSKIINILRACDCCNRQAPQLARHVERLGGDGVNCCLRCLRWLAGSLAVPSTFAAERIERARREMARLFRSLRPLGLIPGAPRHSLVEVRSLHAATLARIGAEGRGNAWQ